MVQQFPTDGNLAREGKKNIMPEQKQILTMDKMNVYVIRKK